MAYLVIVVLLTTTCILALRLRNLQNAARAEVLDRGIAARIDAASHERIASLFEYHPHAVYALDLEGRFVDVNPACERLTGYSRSELLGMDSRALSAPSDAELARASIEDVAAQQMREFETTIQTPDGRVVELRVTGVQIVVESQVTGMYGIAEDVTAAHQMRRDLERARTEAEQANEAKSHFLSNVSHELRTPLTSVLAASEMLRDTATDPEQILLLDHIEGPGQRLLRLVEDLLDFSQLEASATYIAMEGFKVTSMLSGLGVAVRRDVLAKGLEFECRVGEQVPGTLIGDEGRISQVLEKVLENAVKFTDSGSVRLSVEIDRTGSAPAIALAVTDTGIGMTQEQVAGLFAPFSQADPSTTRRHGGTGLGLAICSKLVTLMGGSIDVHSVLGAGTTVTVLLPMAPLPRDHRSTTVVKAT
ncbi:MAG: sensor hybrid histidine kinase [Marmoricola sp.]|nr:sensor hybrid histidine kinase [Marmoricola sp.]